MNKQNICFLFLLKKTVIFFLSEKQFLCDKQVTGHLFFLFNLSCRCTMQMGSSCLNLAPMERVMASSTLQQAWLWTPMGISLLLTGATVGSRLDSENHIYHKTVSYSIYLPIFFFICAS